MADSLSADWRRSAARKRQAAASVSAAVVAIGLIAAVGIVYFHIGSSRPINLLGALINLQPSPAESVSAPINFVQNKPVVLQLTADLGSCFGTAKTVDEGAK